MSLKKLPIGISTLRNIFDDDAIYIDKTQDAYNLITESGRYFFLSRPRRFGKSLFLDTLRCIFEGDKELFRGLYIYDKWDFVKYPVIRINFGDGSSKTGDDFKLTLREILDSNQRNLDIECPKDFSISGCFKRLIEEAYKKYNKQVVVLIDEYDKPILDNIENTKEAIKRREELKNFYSVLKSSDEFIRFVFITGVSKFSKVSLFSGLNNLYDITLNQKYSTICGYTQKDLETSFYEHLKDQDFEKIKKWYNGYKFFGQSIYNPFDILLFIANNFQYRNYWFSTATPTFLLKLIERNKYFLPDLENIVKTDMMLDSFDVDCIDLETLMWQTGYLTITHVSEGYDGLPRYCLKMPNYEVRMSLLGSIAHFMSKIQTQAITQDNIGIAFLQKDFSKLQTALTSLYASIPYHLFTKTSIHKYEGYYVSVFYAYIKALGFDFIGEDVTNKGRIDLTLKLNNSIFIIEFKIDGKDALKQIKDKKYHEKYLNDKKDIFLIGIEFNTKEKNISKFEWEKIKL